MINNRTFARVGDLDIHYQLSDFTDPWRKPETILLLHGNAESSAAWYAWVPLLARHFRVVRPDMRGFGSSTPMARDFPWTVGIIVGVAGARLTTLIAGWPTIISGSTVLAAFLFSLVVGLFFGIYPAHKASRLNPIDALRYE